MQDLYRQNKGEKTLHIPRPRQAMKLFSTTNFPSNVCDRWVGQVWRSEYWFLFSVELFLISSSLLRSKLRARSGQTNGRASGSTRTFERRAHESGQGSRLERHRFESLPVFPPENVKTKCWTFLCEKNCSKTTKNFYYKATMEHSFTLTS